MNYRQISQVKPSVHVKSLILPLCILFLLAGCRGHRTLKKSDIFSLKSVSISNDVKMPKDIL